MPELIRALTWTFIHSVWQGLFAALLSAMIISCTRRSTAKLRYNMLCLVMIMFFVASILTFISQWHGEATRVAVHSAIVAGDAPVIKTANRAIDNFNVWVNTNWDILMMTWAFFFLLTCLRLVTGLATINRLKHYKIHPVTIEWKAKLHQLQRLIGVRYSVSLLQSELVKVPMALGTLKPVIFIPLGLLSHLPAEQVETILLHELSHIRRRDYLVNLLQHMGEAIFFFNPPIRWISSLIRQEREACCDDMVLANCNQKTDYVQALISFQEYSYSHNSHAMSPAMGLSCKRHYLLNRIKRMVTNKNNGISSFEKISLLGGVILFSAFSYIINEPDVRRAPVTIQKPVASVLPIVDSNPKHSSIKKETNKINHSKKINKDTFPEKKSNGKNIRVKEPLFRLTDQKQTPKDAGAALQEIIQIKSQIGLKKESIGMKKSQLTMANRKERDEIMREIERERSELEEQRCELDRKRKQWESLKRQAQNKMVDEKNTDPKTEVTNETSTTIENNSDANDNEREMLISKFTYANFIKKLDFKIDKIKPDKLEQKFILKPQPKDPPPPEPHTAPEKKPEPLGRKVLQ